MKTPIKMVMMMVYAKYIFSSSCLSYACHNFVLFRGMRSANQIMPVIELWFDFRTPLHSVHQAQQIYLFPPALWPPLGFVRAGLATGVGSFGAGAAGAEPSAGAAASACAAASAGAGAAPVVGF